jgi:eukaryotic-like serine/threonine-protein kinase
VDRNGKAQSLYDAPNFYLEGSLSRAGRIAMRVAATHDDIWTFDLAQRSLIRFTVEPGDESYPLWNPDASRIAFGWRVGGVEQIWWQKADGSAAADLLNEGKSVRYPGSFSSDGKSLAFVEIHPERQRDIWLMSLEGDRKAEPFQATAADEFAPGFSPSGSWIVYVSNETGGNEVYVRPMGSSGGRRKISMNGGTLPLWSRDGRELYWVNGNKMMAASFDGKTGQYSGSKLLFELAFLEQSYIYGLTEDGSRFVMSVFQQSPSPTHYQVVEHWFEELKRLVPTQGR